jgi:hypothetical protein
MDATHDLKYGLARIGSSRAGGWSIQTVEVTHDDDEGGARGVRLAAPALSDWLLAADRGGPWRERSGGGPRTGGQEPVHRGGSGRKGVPSHPLNESHHPSRNLCRPPAVTVPENAVLHHLQSRQARRGVDKDPGPAVLAMHVGPVFLVKLELAGHSTEGAYTQVVLRS